MNTRGLMGLSIFILKPFGHFKISWDSQELFQQSCHIVVSLNFEGYLGSSSYTTFRVLQMSHSTFKSGFTYLRYEDFIFPAVNIELRIILTKFNLADFYLTFRLLHLFEKLTLLLSFDYVV